MDDIVLLQILNSNGNLSHLVQENGLSPVWAILRHFSLIVVMIDLSQLVQE